MLKKSKNGALSGRFRTALCALAIAGACAGGSIGGALIGALIMGVLNNGMSIMGISSNTQQVVKGLVLLIAVAIDVIGKQNISLPFLKKKKKAADAKA